MPTITGLVLTFNGERYLRKCLESLSFCDRILVVDSQSTDATQQIAQECGAEVLIRAWEGPVPQFQFALKQIETDWVVSLDQDEWLTPQLSASIQSTLADPAANSHAGYYCSRSSYYFDRYLKHSGWYPDKLLRVFANGRMDVRASGPHYSFHPQGTTGSVTGDIIHHPYHNLSEHLDKINYYTQIAAQELHDKGRKVSLGSAIGHGLARFVKIYLLRRGFLDGKAGLILALHGFFYAFHKYIRVVELNQNSNQQ